MLQRTQFSLMEQIQISVKIMPGVSVKVRSISMFRIDCVRSDRAIFLYHANTKYANPAEPREW